MFSVSWMPVWFWGVFLFFFLFLQIFPQLHTIAWHVTSCVFSNFAKMLWWNWLITPLDDSWRNMTLAFEEMKMRESWKWKFVFGCYLMTNLTHPLWRQLHTVASLSFLKLVNPPYTRNIERNMELLWKSFLMSTYWGHIHSNVILREMDAWSEISLFHCNLVISQTLQRKCSWKPLLWRSVWCLQWLGCYLTVMLCLNTWLPQSSC